MVLSACSSYFEQLFINFSEPNQIVILKDTSFLDISAIIDFMYRGEINVSQVREGLGWLEGQFSSYLAQLAQSVVFNAR